MRIADTTPLVVRIEAGPDAGRELPVDVPLLVLGRRPGPGRIDDPQLEPHHLAVARHAGSIVVTQLAGRLPARVDGVPLAGPVEVDVGAEIELGATCATVDTPQPAPTLATTCVTLGVGPVRPSGGAAAPRRSSVVIDLRCVRRLLVVGPGADGVVRAILAAGAPVSISVGSSPDALRRRPELDRVNIVGTIDPDVGWPDHDLPADGALVSVGASWRAALVRSVDGVATVERFHAAGRPAGGSRSDRSLVAQQVPGAGTEIGGGVVRVPQPAGRQ